MASNVKMFLPMKTYLFWNAENINTLISCLEKKYGRKKPKNTIIIEEQTVGRVDKIIYYKAL